MSTLPRNRFKAGLESGNTQFGLWLGITDSAMNEMLAGAGFDWLVVDHEHGPFELRDVLHALQAIAAYDTAPIVRPVNGEPALLKKLCDLIFINGWCQVSHINNFYLLRIKGGNRYKNLALVTILTLIGL